MITASQVKELRKRTGAGMMECKRALEVSQGDIEAAITAMRKAGQAKVAKKAGRIAAEGVIAIKVSPDSKQAIMVEVNCETDFVARDHSFLEFVDVVVTDGLAAAVTKLDDLLALKSITQMREDLVAKIGENIDIRRMQWYEANGIIGSYVHSNKRIGVLVELAQATPELAKDISMHIAASKPLVVLPEEIPQELLAQEEEICLAQVPSGKSPEILKKMVAGRMQKFIAEITLIQQPFVKNTDLTVGTLLQQAKTDVRRFVRFAVGEGITKKTVDFAAEVKAQVATR